MTLMLMLLLLLLSDAAEQWSAHPADAYIHSAARWHHHRCLWSHKGTSAIGVRRAYAPQS